MDRRTFLKVAAAGTVGAAGCATSSFYAKRRRQPNFVIVFTDDQGYNDLGCFGSPLIKTPRIDRMATEGMRFTDFYSSAPVCTPSRASLMTGCYAQRVGLAAIPSEDGKPGNPRRVLFPDSTVGLHADELTVAELLKQQGYRTGLVGKWHLGHLPPFLPTRHGFDSYFGIPYSNDMKPSPLMRGEETIEEPANQDTLTERYTEEAVRFITENRDRPFFLYLAHNMPHVPLHISERFRGKSAGGLYGDVIECIDWSVGRVLDTLKSLGLDNNTLVIFTSDNGPWYTTGENGGMATPLRNGKGTTYEGGMRVPCIVRWPGTVPAGKVCAEVTATIDVMPTFVGLAGGTVPADRVIDGRDMLPLMTAQPGAGSPHEAYYFYTGNDLQAVRSGPWKYRVATKPGPVRPADADVSNAEALYNLATDPGEQKTVLKNHPDIVERMKTLLELARKDLGDTATDRVGVNVRPIGRA